MIPARQPMQENLPFRVYFKPNVSFTFQEFANPCSITVPLLQQQRCTLALSAHAKTIIVNNNSALNSVSPCSAATQTTINGALGVAVTGDTIEICPGIYAETLKITTSKLTIEGLNVGGSSLVEIEPTTPAAGIPDIGTSLYGPPEDVQVSATIVVQNATKVALENIAVNSSLVGNPGNSCNNVNYVGIYYANASVTITNSTVANSGLNPDGSLTGCQEGHGIYVDSGSGGSASLTVEYNSVHDFDKSGIDAFGNGTTLVAKYNTVTGVGPTTATAQNGVEVIYGASAVVNNNTISAVDYTPNSVPQPAFCFIRPRKADKPTTMRSARPMARSIITRPTRVKRTAMLSATPSTMDR